MELNNHTVLRAVQQRTRLRHYKSLVRLTALLLALTALAGSRAEAQVAEAAIRGEQAIFVGASASGSRNDYGARKLGGVDATVYANANHKLGLEGEASWQFVHQRANVHTETYLIGPRYSFLDFGRFTASGKVLLGNGRFHYPYDFATGSYFVYAPGADLEYWLNRSIRINVADVEYQRWPQFSYGTLTAVKVSVGIQFHVF